MKKINDNVKLKENQRVMPFTLRDVIAEAKKVQPHYSLGAQLAFYVTFMLAKMNHSQDKRQQFIAEQKLKLVKLLVDASEYSYKNQN